MFQARRTVDQAIDDQHCEVSELHGPAGFPREPMTVADMTALRGVVGYVPPGPGREWLTLILADQSPVQVAPADESCAYYLIEPADEQAAARGIQPAFLALWAAYRHLGRLALEALERASIARGYQPDRIAGLEVIEVVAKDHTLPAIRFLEELAAASNNRVRDGVLTATRNVVGVEQESRTDWVS